MSEEEARLPSRHSGRRRVLKWVGICALALVVVLSTSLVLVYKHLEGNITGISTNLLHDRPDKPKVSGPQEPLNVLLMGSDDRKGTNIGGETPGLSDTTILLHLSANRKRAFGISIPRDTMVDRPTCTSKDGKKQLPGGLGSSTRPSPSVGRSARSRRSSTSPTSRSTTSWWSTSPGSRTWSTPSTA